MNARARLAAALASAAFWIFPFAAGADENPYSDNSAGVYTAGASAAAINHNFAVQQKQDRQMKGFLRTMMLNQMIEQQIHNQPLGAPVLTVSLGSNFTIPDAWIAYGERHGVDGEKQTAAGAEHTFRSEIAQYRTIAASRHLTPDNIASACQIAAETLYAVVDRVDPAPYVKSIHGTCALSAAFSETYTTALKTAAERNAHAATYAIDSTYVHNKALKANGDASERDALVKEASGFFKLLFGRDIASYPIEKFPCVIADSYHTCASLQGSVVAFGTKYR